VIALGAESLAYGHREEWFLDRDFSRFAGLAVVNPLVGDRAP
jgi:hypothetical protein